MKKFLTVLLALSVVFTYTVGTAFAAVSADRDVTSEAAAKVATELEKVNAAKTLYLGNLPTETNDFVVDKDVKFVEINNCYFALADAVKVANKAVTEAESVLNDAYAKVIGGTYDNDAALDNALMSISASGYYGANNFTGKVKNLKNLTALELQYAQERYTAVINTVKPEDYSTKVDENGDSNYSKVDALQKAALKGIDNAANAYGENGARAVAEKFFADIKNIKTVTDDSYDAKDLEAAKEIAIAKLTAAYAEAKANDIAAQNDIIRENERKVPQTDATKKAIADAEKEIKDLTAEYDAAVTLMTSQIKAVESFDDVIYYCGGSSAGTIGTISKEYKYTMNSNLLNTPIKAGRQLAVKKVAKIDALKDSAELAKQYIGIEGSKYYSVEEVETALETAIEKVYPAKGEAGLEKITIEALTPAEVLEAKIKALTGENGKAKVVIDNKAYETVLEWAKAVDENKYNYNGSDAVKDEIKALAKDTKDALWETTSVEEAEKVFLEAYKKFDAYMTAEEYNELYAEGGALYAKATSYGKQIKAAVNAKHTLVDASGKYDFDTNKTDAAGSFADKLIKEMRTATNVADLDTKYAEAIATIDNLKTVDELTAEAKALNDKALTIKDAVAQKAEAVELMDAYNAFKAYVDLIDSNKAYVLYDAKVKANLQTVANAEAKAIEEAIKAVGTVTTDDKDAIEQIRADFDAYKALVDDYKLTAATKPTENEVAGLETKLSAAEVDAVIKAIAVAGTDMTAENVAKIKELQAAYDVLTTSQKAKITGLAYDKYVALIKLADKYEITTVESLKVVKNHSVAGKGYIKIAWSVKGDAAAADGYQIYRATKANGKYTKFFTTSKMTYKNTKSLKKGTKYFYKVRAYKTVDGVKYYSDWSNKAYRVAK